MQQGGDKGACSSQPTEGCRSYNKNGPAYANDYVNQQGGTTLTA